MLIVQRLKLFPNECLRAPDPAQHHLHQLILVSPARLAQQGEQQRLTPARLSDIQQIAQLHGRRLGRELTQLGVGDSFQRRGGLTSLLDSHDSAS